MQGLYEWTAVVVARGNQYGDGLCWHENVDWATLSLSERKSAPQKYSFRGA
ncbi:Uncharacterised protein [Chlamydia trachomatis]|nr:Uncharacterised protein [Chlamydia trachomatis]